MKVRTTPPRHALFGLIYAGLGQREEGERVVELLLETKDAFDGPILAISRARISLKCGDVNTALALLERSLVTSSGSTVHELRLASLLGRPPPPPAFSTNAGASRLRA